MTVYAVFEDNDQFSTLISLFDSKDKAVSAQQRLQQEFGDQDTSYSVREWPVR